MGCWYEGDIVKKLFQERWFLLLVMTTGLFCGRGAREVCAQSNWTIIGWNNLGMHCMDSDFTVFSILPPYNTIHAQIINNQGRLVTNAAGIGVTYHAISDLDGSFNASSIGKGNFWENSAALFGISPPPETGLPVPGPDSFHMPGTSNVPQSMMFESGMKWFAAYGIPITPYDDKGKPNQYPMMRLKATNSSGQVLAITDIVLPVSDEMDCKLCHSSGSGPEAEPAGGWLWIADPGKDYRLNILRLHDEKNMTDAKYTSAMAINGFNTNGLFPTVIENKRPILCASCHLSEALPGSGIDGIKPLTEAIHAHHASVVDPRNGMTLNSSANRVACYSCHPGSVTRCLRGAMGKAVAPDGSMMMQCQSCHGGMTMVGSSDRTGWLEEPNCQSCHAGSAINSLGVIRFTDSFTNGTPRTPADKMFATSPDTPLPGISLYRFSSGHGGLQCAACHGSTHAEFPSALPSDNVANVQKQGHAGTLSECTACHPTMPITRNGGPHGMHRTGQAWINDHNNAAQALGLNACRTCHGSTGQGSVLSLAFSDKAITSEKGNINYWRGRKVTCFSCHDGMNSSDPTTRGFPSVTNVSAVTTSGVPVVITLTGPNIRMVDQAHHGAVALAGNAATYYPDAAYFGEDTFTFAANNGFNDSNLGVVSIAVRPNPAGVPAPDATRLFDIRRGGSNTEIAFVSSLGNAYRLEESTNLVEGEWHEAGTSMWGHTDSTRIPDPQVFEYMHCYRIVSIDPPPHPMAAADSATNSVYDPGWNSGVNGGTGFTGWSLAVNNGLNGGFFIGTTNNASMSAKKRAWGLWANSGSTAIAERALSAPLAVGDALMVRFDNNLIQNGGLAGMSFMNASGQLLLEFFFIGGQSAYRVNDRAGSRLTKIPWSNSGWDVSLRVSAAGEYNIVCGPYYVPGFFKVQNDQSVARIRIINGNAGTGSNYDVFADDLRVVKP
jgi:hypothetical protein